MPDIGTELGTSGLRRNGGQVDEQLLRQLKGSKGRKVFEEMSRYDEVVAAVLHAINMIVRQVEWGIEPGSDEPKAQEVADFVETCRWDMSHSWSDTISEALTMLPFGWAALEIVYKKRQGTKSEPGDSSRFNDGKYGWRKLPLRAQHTLYEWIFDEGGGVQGLRQKITGMTPTAIPIERLLLFRTQSNAGNPEGRSILERAYKAWYYKIKLQELEAIGIERDLAGLPIAWVPPELLSADATTDQQTSLEAFKDLTVNVRRDEQEGIVMPLEYDDKGNKLYDFKLLTSGGDRQHDTGQVITRYDRAIAGSVLADFIMLGSDSSGSFALSKDKTDLFLLALQAVVSSIEEVFNRHAIPRLLSLNGIPLEDAPKLRAGEIGRVTLAELGEFVDKLAGAGMALFPDPELESYLRSEAGLPGLPDTEGESASTPTVPTST